MLPVRHDDDDDDDYLYFINLFTRFCKSNVIRRKNPKVDSIATKRIGAGFGPPKKFLVDNEKYRELAIEICATAAYTLWSNDILEKRHYVLDVCVLKMMEEDPKMEVNMVLTWAVRANTLDIVQFSLYWVTTPIYPQLWKIKFHSLKQQKCVIQLSNILILCMQQEELMQKLTHQTESEEHCVIKSEHQESDS